MIPTCPEENNLFAQLPAYVRAMVPYRPGKPIEELKEEYGFEKVIKLASNENPFGVSPKALAAMQAHLTDNARYPDPISRRLRRTMASSLGISPEELIVTAGGESLIATIVRSMMHPGDKAVTGFGAFMGFEIHLSAHGGELIKVPSPGYRFDVDALIQATTPDTRILYLPNPNNPTGSHITHQELETLLNGIPKTTLLFLDEAYIEFARHLPDYPDAMALRRENLLILRTFSKAYGLAGLRIGYGIGHPSLIEQLTKVKMTFEPSHLAQVAAEAAWQDSDFIDKALRNNTQEMKRYYEVLESLGLQYQPSAGNFIFVAFDSQEQVNTLNEALLKRGIAIRPLASFGFPNCIRITVGLPEENDALFQALREILPSL